MTSSARLSALDASFLAVETPAAHMHVGWAAKLAAPAGGRLPHFVELRDHIAARLSRAPRYRQKLAPVPLGVHAPEWVDDPGFSVERHVYRAPGPLAELVDEVLSTPLRRERPLWEIWICEEPETREIGLVGKVHHCMVDGIAAVELASLLLDPSPEPPANEDAEWHPTPPPSAERLLVRGLVDLLGAQLSVVCGPLRAATSPARATRQAAAGTTRVLRALSHSLGIAPASALNGELSPQRHLVSAQRPLCDIQAVKRRHGTTVNDVMLAAVAGAMRAYLMRRGELPVALKAMVPVSVRSPDDALGNHISFVFAELPCDEPDPLTRLRSVHETMSRRKSDGEPEGADLALRVAALTLPAVQHALSRLIASPRTFNLVVSNIPGPTEPLYMLGCPLQATYPVVPLAERHALSIGMTSVCDLACFGICVDREALPDADQLAHDIDTAITELLE
jgi:diacylglycerol O-acyltransferase / wax synthase